MYAGLGLLAGALTTFAVNFTFSLRDTPMVFTVAILAYSFAGWFLASHASYSIGFFCGFIGYFILLASLNLTVFLGILFITSIISLFSGVLMRKLLKKNKLVVLLLIGGIIAIGLIAPSLVYKKLYQMEYNMLESPISLPKDVFFLSADGDTVFISELTDDAYFIETWHIKCGACKQQFPIMDSLAFSFKKGDGIKVLVINNGLADTFEEFKEFVRQSNQYSFEFLYDSNKSMASLFNFYTSPNTFFAVPGNSVVFYHSGFNENNTANFKNELGRLMKHLSASNGKK